MCVNYQTTTKTQLTETFSIEAPAADWKEEVWQDYAAPIILNQSGQHKAVLASYGLLPKDKQPQGKRLSTMNARAETVGQLPTYRQAWSRNQLCLVPMLGFYEPCYESGKPIRWRIQLKDKKPFSVAGIWRVWDEGTEDERYSFTQLTINADGHPLMNRFHPPQDEKRSLVVIPADAQKDWLNCSNPEYARAFLELFPAELMASEPAPPPPRKPITSAQSTLF